MKHTIFSGIRATGRLHLGNYLGAVKGMLALQNEPDYTTYFMSVDAHSVTTPFNPSDLADNRREVIVDYLAAGLDPKKSVLTLQSMVEEHLILAFYFSTVISIARMQHLPTFKEKVKQHPANASMALLNYPILMASDILIYKADLVPIGIDQEPHLEIAREVARKMNELYGLDFPEPVRFSTSGGYVPSLKGEGKMSKTVEGSSINLNDDLETISKRLAGALTDSGKGTISETTTEYAGKSTTHKQYVDASGTPSIGVANLLSMVELLQGADRRDEYEAAYVSTGLRYGEVKAGLATAIYELLQPLQDKRAELVANPQYVTDVIVDGAARARLVARATLEEVKDKMGLRSMA